MLRKLDPKTLGQIEHFALAIARTGPDQEHAGMLYRDGDGEVWLLHLAWHHKLCAHRVLSNSACLLYQWAKSSIHRSNCKLLAVLCDKMRTGKPEIPYGLDRAGIHINRDTGGVDPGDPGKGLTCSTIILALLDQYGITLLKEDEWPANANGYWQAQIMARLSDPKWQIPPVHIEALSKDVGGTRRFTPCEVVGASTEKKIPLGFEQATKLANKVARKLNPFNEQISGASC